MYCRNLEGILLSEEKDLIELNRMLHPSEIKYTAMDYPLNIKAYDYA